MTISRNTLHKSAGSLQPPSNMQKTWSTDSIHESFAGTSSSARLPSIDIDRPRKHASRSALNGQRSSQYGNGFGESTSGLGASGSGSRLSSNRLDADDIDSFTLKSRRASHRYSEGTRGTSERNRFRDTLHGSNGKQRKRSKARTESMPASSNTTDGPRAAKTRGQITRTGNDGDDEEALNDRGEGGSTSSFTGTSRSPTKTAAMSKLDTIDSRTDSAGESSATYAAGPSGYDGVNQDEDATSDSSSSEGHHFDWDTPQRKAAAASSSLQLPSQRTAIRRLSRNGDGNLNRHSLAFGAAEDSHDTGGGGSTPTRRRFQATLPESDEAHSDSSAAAVKKRGRPFSLTRLQENQAATSIINTTPVSRRRPRFRAKARAFLSNPVAEAILLLAGSVAIIIQLKDKPTDLHMYAHELGLVAVLSSLYYFFLRTPTDMGTIWATDHRNYRPSGDDGAMCGLLSGPLLAMACLFGALNTYDSAFRPANGDSLPDPPWRIEAPVPILSGLRQVDHPQYSALVLSRSSLVSIQTLTSIVLLIHLLATKYIRRPDQLSPSNWEKLWSYAKFSTTVTIMLALLREVLVATNSPLWSDLPRSTVIIATHLFQSNLYAISRLARKSFTLGELAIVATIGMTLILETINLTAAKLTPVTTAYIETYRRPTPLLVFQLALVVGTFMIGFLLSPLLYLSRNLAQKPLHRLRWPHKRDLHRRLLAFFFYLFAALFVVGVLGLWVWWLLGKRNPWIWVARFIISGDAWWSRPLLITYWVALVSASIAGWQATVFGGKRFRMRSSHGNVSSQSNPPSAPASQGNANAGNATSGNDNAATSAEAEGKMHSAASSEQSHGTLPSTASSGALFPKRAAYLSLNARRKFFHALAVLLFAPGIAYDPAFMHLAFSLAFSIFIFAEYVRYYALFPFGAALHVFLSEFTDHKDSGPVILSHFYLLTGCAGTVWIEGLGKTYKSGPVAIAMASRSWVANISHIFGGQKLGLQSMLRPAASSHLAVGHADISLFIGVLTLGIADAVASIVGRRYGRLYWPRSSKTLEGSFAFIASLIMSASALHFAGWTAPFSLMRFSYVAVILGIFEGISNQNDNLVLPLYGAVALSIFAV